MLKLNEALPLLGVTEQKAPISHTPAVGIMFWVGICPHEVELLRWEDVHLEAGVISISSQHSKMCSATPAPPTTFRNCSELELEMGRRSATILRTRYIAMESSCNMLVA